jgi:hypothetical protein
MTILVRTLTATTSDALQTEIERVKLAGWEPVPGEPAYHLGDGSEKYPTIYLQMMEKEV